MRIKLYFIFYLYFFNKGIIVQKLHDESEDEKKIRSINSLFIDQYC